MKAFKTLLLLLALGLSVYGQAVNVTANKLKGSATAPSGACSAQQVQLTTAGVVYVCASGTWTSSGGGTTINSTNGTVPYRTGATTFADSPLTVNAPAGTGIAITSAAAGSGVTVGVTSSGSNENLLLSYKGSAQIIVPVVGSSASSPTIAFAGNANTGIYWITTHQVGIASGGAPAMAIDGSTVTLGSWGASNHTIKVASGGVGNPNRGGTNLIVTSGESTGNGASADIIFKSSPSGTAGMVENATVEAMRIFGNAQMVGIGVTASPTAQLDIASQSTTRPGLKLRALSGTSSSQNVLESYDASGTLTANLQSDGTLKLPIGAASNSRPIYAGSGANGWDVLNNNSGYNFILERPDSTPMLAVNVSRASVAGLGLGSTSNVTSPDLFVERDAANTLAQRNSTNAQTFRLYETYTDGSNYERLEINASATTNTIKPAAAGTGTASKIDYYLTPTVFISSGTGSPEGVLTAGIGSMYARTDGGAGTSFYVKESGTGNTGWIAK